MVRPQEVRAPKEKIEILAIIEDGTQTKKGYSIALIKWKGKKGVAVRWDGDNQQDKGFPITANGYHPAWFVLPDKFTELYSYDYAKTVTSIKALDKLAEEQHKMDEKKKTNQSVFRKLIGSRSKK
ncbi:hypothetical protein HV425_09590 [Enterococcus faecium]|nr:hypothetical protein [Enterococcus faecium]NVF25775.1 hypothetical protein [Enterococcus faecium]